jgi:2-dehydro-3-deoxyphosphogluconate aldolase/(4S)-4-hydroxy-2-oxoglutarate aldolase
MLPKDVLAAISASGVIPVVRTTDADQALGAVDALHRGGIRVIEIATTVAGPAVLERVASTWGQQIVLGAGTIVNAQLAEACMQAGAAFLLSPVLKVDVIEVARRHSTMIMAGALTPTEVLTAWEAGADAVRIVPCGPVGGPGYLRALTGPFPHIPMVPTGGVTLQSIDEYFQAGAFAVGIRGGLIDSVNLNHAQYDVFAVRARRYLAAVNKYRQRLAPSKET